MEHLHFNGKNPLFCWKVHCIVFFMVILTELAGPYKLKLGVSSIVLFPMLYVLVLGTVLSLKRFKVLSEKERELCANILEVSLMLFMAKLGSMLGPSLNELSHLGGALILQEIGHFLGTIVLGLPVAMLLGMKRESIGATFSVDRDPNLAIMAEKYGVESPEFKGTFGVYICGTLFGALYLGVLSSWLSGTGLMDPIALAMAAGVGSASMMAAASGAIAGNFPERAQEIAAVAGAANLVTTILSPYVSVLISLPVTVKLYNLLDKLRRPKTNEQQKGISA